VAEPPILLLDEPTRGLDPAEKHRLAHFLRAQAAGGRTIVMATHDVELVGECAQRVVVLEEGRVALDGPTGEVMSQADVLATQVLKLFRHPRLLTVQDVLEAHSHAN
jgi:energy-coupling factor transport system ATP-binding protein